MLRLLQLAFVSLLTLTNAMIPLDALPQQTISHTRTMHIHVRTNTNEMISLDVPQDNTWHSVNSEAVTCWRECTDDLIVREGMLAKHSVGLCRLATDFIGKTFEIVNNGTGPVMPMQTGPAYHILHVCCGLECLKKQPMGWPSLEEPVIGDERKEV